MSQRIGIFSGVFDPVHTGYISFALESADKAKLDEVYFLIESQPRRKQDVTHQAHRLAMLKLALASHTKLKTLEMPDKQMSVAKTLPRLKQRFSNSKLVYLAGADMLEHMPDWPLIDRMLEQMDLVIGTKGLITTVQAKDLLKKFSMQ